MELPPELGRRYLKSFHPNHIPHRFTDVLVIGSGVAGLSAALTIASDPEMEVLVVGKAELEETATGHAQGGVAAVLLPERTGDSLEDHIQDTVTVAGGLANEDIVRLTVTEGVERVRALLDLGLELDRDTNGEPLVTREGGHSFPRIVHRGDTTGDAIERVLISAVSEKENILCLPFTFAIDLLGPEGVCHGALLYRQHGELEAVWARQTILATGGGGRLYRETTSPAVCSADGIAMAFRAGAVLQDLEFMQFHPTTLYLAGAERFLITEAVRGEGGILRDACGRAFMEGVHPLKDLAPRDVVSRSILRVMKEQGENKVWLDLSAIPEEKIERRFPHIFKMCHGFGIDIRREPIPVRPSAHYSVGGVETDRDGRTSVDGLFAAGEVASTGLHGANRLASNSLLEGMVFGHRAGRAASERAKSLPLPAPLGSPPEPPKEPPRQATPKAPSRAATRTSRATELNREDLLTSLRSVMWYKVGVERNGQELASALEQLTSWVPYGLGTDMGDPDGWSLQNMLQVASLLTFSALRREESRGVHYRTDFPEADDKNWKRHQRMSREML